MKPNIDGTVMLIIKTKKSSCKECEITPEPIYQQRRKFIQTSAAGLTASTLAASLMITGCDDAKSTSSLNETKDNTTTAKKTQDSLTPYKDITQYNNFYEFGLGKDDPAKYATNFPSKPWTVSVEGEVDKPGVFNLDDILKPHSIEERIYRLRCVEAWSMVIPWNGFPLAELIKRFSPNSQAKFVQFFTLHDKEQMPGQRRPYLDWPYREGLTIDEAMNPLAFIATGLYGKDLLGQNGAPLRLVVPWKYGFKSIKSIVKIRFTSQQPRTSWSDQAPSEYGFYANVNPNVNHPRWSQRKERRIGEFRKRDTLMFNGYSEEVAHLYAHLDLKKYF